MKNAKATNPIKKLTTFLMFSMMMLIGSTGFSQQNMSSDLTSFFNYGGGNSEVALFAHPAYVIVNSNASIHNGYVQVTITYEGRIRDYSDTYRLYWNSSTNNFSSIEVISDGNKVTSAFFATSKLGDLVGDCDSKACVKIACLEYINKKWKNHIS